MKKTNEYTLARERYAETGVDTEKAVKAALEIPVSIHNWQVDDIVGFEVKTASVSGGGIMATGNYPGRARTPEEARADYEKVLSLIPGKHRLNLHALYADTNGKRVERDDLQPRHFESWMQWSRKNHIPLDFNPTYFGHPKADSGFTLSSKDESVRKFWVRHGIAARRIAEAMAKSNKGVCHVNHWIPDGSKDLPADRWTHRSQLTKSLDETIAQEKRVDKSKCLDYVESKLFGLGSEEYVVGSSEYYSSYAASRNIGLCMDMGHYHPTETIHDKISSFLQFHKKLLLHVSRPMRWDSDHVVIFNDDLKNLFLEIGRGGAWKKVAVATDYFDASINRIAAYAIGLRATRKAILFAMLDPSQTLRKMEEAGDRAGSLALMDEMKFMPIGAVWAELCRRDGAPQDMEWMDKVRSYEKKVLLKRK